MALSDEKVRSLNRRLLLSRMRILCSNGFYGLLLMHMIFSLDEEIETAATDGVRIYFSPKFLEELSDKELDFVMMHEIVHVVLQHCMRGGDRDNELFNIACDIVVNSNILRSNGMDISSITLKKYGVAMHFAPDGKDGFNYTAEQVYAMFPRSVRQAQGGNAPGGGDGSENKSNGGKGNSSGNANNSQNNSRKGNGNTPGGGSGSATAKNGRGGRGDGGWDDHTRWGSIADEDKLRDIWVKRFEDACKAIEIRDPSNSRGMLPLFAERILKEMRKPQTDWRTILNEFVQEEVSDYSFTPPDRRYESPFFLPDFNDKDYIVENILFMIDTSGSMSDEMITAAYSEIKGAIDQFDGKLKGWLGFFDAGVVEPKPFENEDEFKVIKPAGGGGTSFTVIFKYIEKYMQDNLPVSIVILTDGCAPYPNEQIAMGIPVLWLINNDKITPPWGKIARITV